MKASSCLLHRVVMVASLSSSVSFVMLSCAANCAPSMWMWWKQRERLVARVIPLHTNGAHEDKGSCCRCCALEQVARWCTRGCKQRCLRLIDAYSTD